MNINTTVPCSIRNDSKINAQFNEEKRSLGGIQMYIKLSATEVEPYEFSSEHPPN